MAERTIFLARGARQAGPPLDDATETLVLEPREIPSVLRALASGEMPVASQALALMLALRFLHDAT